MLKSNENMKMKMGGLGTAQSLVGHALSARHQDSDLHTLLSQGIEWSNKGKQTMKKLMFVAAAALCGSLFADISSANIVGYTQAPATYGYKPMGFAFKQVGAGEEIDIQSIKPVAPDGGAIDDDTYFIYELNEGGACTSYYIFENANGDDYPKTGWYNEDMEFVEDRTFKQGEGFIFNVDMDDAGVQTAGEVDLGEIVTPGVYGYCPMSNPYPIKISIQDITPVPPEGTEEIDDDTYFIYELNEGGACTSYYIFENANGDDYPYTGWYNEDLEFVEDRFFEAGEGFIFNVDMDGAGAAFKVPETK